MAKWVHLKISDYSFRSTCSRVSTKVSCAHCVKNTFKSISWKATWEPFVPWDPNYAQTVWKTYPPNGCRYNYYTTCAFVSFVHCMTMWNKFLDFTCLSLPFFVTWLCFTKFPLKICTCIWQWPSWNFVASVLCHNVCLHVDVHVYNVYLL